ncbi:MAG: arginine--tRNA ligase [Candidatus Aminicenantes bacterium]|nr:MAG: arginine--tRNA ligase [Candidatus Aminicenantes bacterium]
MKYLQENLKDRLYELLKSDFDLEREEIRFSIPPKRDFGDLSTTIPFVLAKKRKQKPFSIGNRIIEKIKDRLDMFSHIKLAGGGFLNFYFKKNFLLNYLKDTINREPVAKGIKMVVEHTSINPNKSAHIGHLRNACLGDTLAKSLQFLGYDVEVQNYLDDTGIQVADVVWGLMVYEGKNLDEIKKIPHLASYLWDLYPKVSQLFAENEEAKHGRDETHKKIEEKIDPEYSVNQYIAQEVLKDHIRVMHMLGIRYDLLVRESDIIELDFFKEARELMESKGVMYPSQDPEKKGCMVIQYEKEKTEKIIIRSNGTVTYIGKDIAYTLWKVGLFDRDFYYRKFYTYEEDNKPIYMTDFHPNQLKFNFGGGESVFNVIDVRQSYLQNIISQTLGPLSPAGHRKKFVHFSYEMVALTPRCVEEMGFELSEEDREREKSYVEVSGRKGIAIKGDELIEKLVEKSIGEVKLRHPEMEKEKINAIAKEIAIGALRYFMIKFNANSVIAFDFKDALAFEGDTGPYLQYTLVRINSILRKLEEKQGSVKIGKLNGSILEKKEYDIFYEMLLELSQVEIQVELALENHELSGIANYTYSLCQKFNHFYHLFPIIAEQNLQLKQLRLQLLLLVKAALEKLVGIMGIPIPEKM